MTTKNRSLSPSEAARRLGVSTKTLRLYEQRALISPVRTEAGWRCYRPEDIDAATKIVALRKLGLSLGQVERVLRGDCSSLESALAAHEEDLVQRIQELQGTAAKVRQLRTGAREGGVRGVGELPDLMMPHSSVVASFDLPWPWGGELFDVERPRSLNFIIGPLASGKTRLAKRLAEVLPEAGFLGLERLANGCDEAHSRLKSNPSLKSRVDMALAWLMDEGAEVSDALIALLAGLEDDTPALLIVDLIEQDLMAATQEALGTYLRRYGRNPRQLFVMTRSSSILDLNQARPDESIILCPPNHSPPMYVSPYKGAPGYEAVSLCLAPPEVRKRTEGVVAIRRAEFA